MSVSPSRSVASASHPLIVSPRSRLNAVQLEMRGIGAVDRLFAKAGEGSLVLGVDVSSSRTTATSTTTGTTLAAATTAITAITSAVTTTITTVTTASTTAVTTASAAASTAFTAGTTTGAATGTFRLNEARVKVNSLLDLALTLTELLATSSSDILLLVVLECLGASPLLVELAALVSLTDLVATKSELLLSLLGEVVAVRDALVFGLSRLDLGISGGVLVALGNSLGGLLVLELGVTLVGAPALSSLLGSGAIKFVS